MENKADRKSKWSSNPCGNNWSKDENKYGQRLLEKMGWSKGKGLGKNEDGNPDHVKAKMKNDAKGLGFNGYDDVWLTHQQEFNNVLSRLNAEENAENNTKTSRNGSEELKNVKKRVHRYKKVIDARDLSTKSDKDLKCIFGTSNEEKDSSDADAVYRPNCGSMDDYFAKKLEEKRRKEEDETQVQENKEEKRMRKKLEKERRKASEPNEEMEENSAAKNERKTKNSKILEETEETVVAKRKKKSKVEDVEKTCPTVEKKKKKEKKCQNEVESENNNEETCPAVEKMKKKEKKHEVEVESENNDEGMCFTVEKRKKKEKKCEVESKTENNDEETCSTIKKRKKKEKKCEVESKTENNDEETCSTIKKRKKKEKKCEVEVESENNDAEMCSTVEKKKKKEKKCEVESKSENDGETCPTIEKKKKKKKKNESQQEVTVFDDKPEIETKKNCAKRKRVDAELEEPNNKSMKLMEEIGALINKTFNETEEMREKNAKSSSGIWLNASNKRESLKLKIAELINGACDQEPEKEKNTKEADKNKELLAGIAALINQKIPLPDEEQNGNCAENFRGGFRTRGSVHSNFRGGFRTRGAAHPHFRGGFATRGSVHSNNSNFRSSRQDFVNSWARKPLHKPRKYLTFEEKYGGEEYTDEELESLKNKGIIAPIDESADKALLTPQPAESQFIQNQIPKQLEYLGKMVMSLQHIKPFQTCNFLAIDGYKH